MLVSLHGFVYSRFSDPAYLDEIMQVSKQKWDKTNDAAESFIGNWTSFQTPINSAWYNFRDLIVLLVLLSFFITIIYYLRNRKRLPYHNSKENHELIF
jgi:hypothetical protein